MFRGLFIIILCFLIFKLSRRFKINENEYKPKHAWLYKFSIAQTVLNYLILTYLFIRFETLEEFIQSLLDGADNLTLLIDSPIFALIWVVTSLVSFRIAHNYYGIEIYYKR